MYLTSVKFLLKTNQSVSNVPLQHLGPCLNCKFVGTRLGAAAPELSIPLEGLPGFVRGASSEGRRSELLSPAIHPDQWLAL